MVFQFPSLMEVGSHQKSANPYFFLILKSRRFDLWGTWARQIAMTFQA